MVAEALVISEKESFVLDDGPAEPSSELMLLQRFGALGEVICGVEGVIPQKLPERSMKFVRSGAGDDVGRRTQCIAKLCVGVVRQNLEFGNCIKRRLKDEAPIHTVEVVGAVDQEIIGFRSLTVHGVCLTIAEGSTGFAKSWSQGRDSGLQQTQLRKIAPV